MCRCVVWWKETAAYIFRTFWCNLKRAAAADNCVLECDIVLSGSHRRFRRNFACFKAIPPSILKMEAERLLELTLCSFEVTFRSYFLPPSPGWASTLMENIIILNYSINQPQCTLPHSTTTRSLRYHPRHASGIHMPIFRRKDCIHTAIWYLRSL
jgi:hypothetical protein